MKNPRIVLKTTLAFVIIAASAWFSYWLMTQKNITFNGDNAVTLVILGSVLAVLMVYGGSIQEFRAFGAEIKFTKLKREAEEALDNLQKAQIKTYRSLLNQTKKTPGGFGDQFGTDERIPEFVSVVNDIIAMGIEKDLKQNINEGIDFLIEPSLRALNRSVIATQIKDKPVDEVIKLGSSWLESHHPDNNTISSTNRRVIEVNINQIIMLIDLRDKLNK